MPVYEYVAISPTGKTVKGTVDSENPRTARQRLRAQGIYATDLREAAEASTQKAKDVRRYFKSDRVSTKSLCMATRQLATLVSAGLPLVSALQSLADQTSDLVLKRNIVTVREHVEEGMPLNKALAEFPRSFPRLYLQMVAAGEASGTLDTVLENLADYLEAQMELKRKVISALVYPMIMFSFGIVVILVLMTFVIPQMVAMFQQQKAELPLPTTILIGISNFIISAKYILIAAVIGAIFGVRFYYRQPHGRAAIDRLLLKLPIFRTIYIKICSSRIASTLGALLSSGVDLLQALEITRNIIGNVHIAQLLADAREGVREGKSLASELNQGGILPTMLAQMVAIGEKSGQLENMLKRAGKTYQTDVDASLAGLTSLLEPLLLIFVGLFVVAIMVAVLMPMLNLIDTIQV